MTNHKEGTPMFIEFFAPKGGVGCSTMAAATALAAERPVHLVAHRDSDLPVILGIPNPHDGEAKVGLGITLHLVDDPGYLASTLHGSGEDVIVDSGRHAIGWGRYASPEPTLYGVVRNCYLYLRAATSCCVRPTGWVMVCEPGRSLTIEDAERSLGRPVVATVDVDPATARTMDAGLLIARPPRRLLASARKLVPAMEVAA